MSPKSNPDKIRGIDHWKNRREEVNFKIFIHTGGGIGDV